jgi:hypothetical protein
MREDVVNTPTAQDSSEDADYTFTNRQLARYRERRAEALVGLPDVPLFFSRLDYPRGVTFDAGPAEQTSWTEPSRSIRAVALNVVGTLNPTLSKPTHDLTNEPASAPWSPGCAPATWPTWSPTSACSAPAPWAWTWSPPT